MPPEPDPHDASDGERAWAEQCESWDRSRSTTRSEYRRQELDRAHNEIRHKARVGKGVKAENKAKAGNIVRARGGPKVIGAKRVENVTDMNHVGLGFDCPRVNERCWTSPPAVLHREMDGAPSIRHL